MRSQLLTEPQARFLRDEKEALAEIRQALADLEVPAASLATLQKAILQLDELFLLVVVGEFNAGKSALVNALLGEKVLPEGATPTTSRVTLVKWGPQAAEEIVDEGFPILPHPLQLLKQLNIVDTPGTNAVIRRHERLTEEFVPRSDLVIFATSADRPMTESERQFLERILAWGKKVVFVLNKADILEGDGDLQEYTAATLDDATRLALKFTNPVGVADNLAAHAEATVREEAEAAREDAQTVALLESGITAYERELESALPPRWAEVETIAHRL